MLANRSREHVRVAFLRHSIDGKADRVQEALGLQKLVHLRRGEGGIGADVAPQFPVTISVDALFPHLAPAIGAMHVEISLPWNSSFKRRSKSTRLGESFASPIRYAMSEPPASPLSVILISESTLKVSEISISSGI